MPQQMLDMLCNNPTCVVFFGHIYWEEIEEEIEDEAAHMVRSVDVGIPREPFNQDDRGLNGKSGRRSGNQEPLEVQNSVEREWLNPPGTLKDISYGCKYKYRTILRYLLA